MTETVTITKEEYESLLADKERLDLLDSEIVEIVYLDCGTLCLRSTVNEVKAFPALNVRRGIDESKKKIESSTKENEKGWISVKDRLPEIGQQVIAIIDGVAQITIYDCEEWFAYNFEWIDGTEWNGTHVNIEQVTHWRPLPPPPTE
ncbi:DUF551 domain-containing protein [Pasteurella canis]|uniref:DUF551 domain-containing protein n=1 Tax=Pasteurella canis TaxID=753 RepID=UPI001E4B307E|nr:DUF551 domain-containing protein [Pasteurella canis]UEA17557.1 DUF551 domain-containing protein [Pasteurella canis]